MDIANIRKHCVCLLVLSLSMFSGCKLEEQKTPVTNQTTTQGQPFIAIADSISTAIDSPVVIQVMNNDTGVTLSTGLRLSLSVMPGSGNAVINLDNSITYTPSPGYQGTDSFEYSLTDNNGNISLATVTVQVICQNCSNQVTISWQSPQDPNIAGYYVYHGSQSRNYPEKVWVGNTLAYNFTNVASGDHFYSVTTVSSTGTESGYSTEVMVTLN